MVRGTKMDLEKKKKTTKQPIKYDSRKLGGPILLEKVHLGP